MRSEADIGESAIGVRRTTGRRVLALNLRTLVREFKGPAINEQRRQRTYSAWAALCILRRGIDGSVRLGAFRCSGPLLSPTCQMILHVVGDLLTDRRQLKHLVLDGGIIGLLG